MIDHFKRHAWLEKAVTKRLQEELAKVGLEMDKEKTKIIDFSKPKQTFKFMGFDFRACITKKSKMDFITTSTKQASNKLRSKMKETFKVSIGETSTRGS